MFGLAITLGAYCGSIRTTSAPVALRRVRPSCRSEACGDTALSRNTEFVPACHSTRSGFSAITAVIAEKPDLVLWQAGPDSGFRGKAGSPNGKAHRLNPVKPITP